MTDHSADIRQYVSTVDDACVAGIVRHCGIALQSRDGAVVSCSDATERARVRDGFLRKKLGRTESDEELDRVVLDVCAAMKGSRLKPRVTFYYLLAERFGALGTFRKA